jgi:tetratricopeptide (TPR) repeat protein
MIAALLLLAVLGGEDVATLFRAAREAERRGDLAGAVARYDEVLALDGSIAEAWANKGLALYELERHREALAAFETAARLKPGLLIPQLFRGLEHLRFGEPRKAVAPLEAVLKLDPDNPRVRYPLAIAYLNLSQATGRKLVAAG